MKKIITSSVFLKAFFGIGCLSVIIKIIGYFDKLFLSYFLGTSPLVDVYTLVLNFVISIFVFSREIVEPIFMPFFIRAINPNSNERWNVFFYFAMWIVFLSGSIAIVGFLNAYEVVHILAPGLSSSVQEVGATLIQVGIPAVIFLALSSLTNATLNAMKIFALPMFSELVFKVMILLFLVSLFSYLSITAAMIGVLVGSLVKLLIQAYPIYKLRPSRFSYKKPELTAAKSISIPLIIGMAFSQINLMAQGMLVSYAPAGSIAALSYAKKIIDVPVLIFPYLLSVVAFPFFSEFSAAKAPDKLSKLLSSTLSWIILIFVPLAIYIGFFSRDIVEIIFKRGAFDLKSTTMTATPLTIYAYGLPFFAVETILVIFFYANADTKRPVIIGILSTIVDFILCFCLLSYLGYTVIALALVLSKALKVVMLTVTLNKRMPGVLNIAPGFAIKIAAACLLLIPIFLIALRIREGLPSNVSMHAVFLAGCLIIGAVFYWLILKLLKLDKGILLKDLP